MENSEKLTDICEWDLTEWVQTKLKLVKITVKIKCIHCIKNNVSRLIYLGV